MEDFKTLFVEVVRLARELGLASFGKLSIDGTKVRATASKRKVMSYGRMQEEERCLDPLSPVPAVTLMHLAAFCHAEAVQPGSVVAGVPLDFQ